MIQRSRRVPAVAAELETLRAFLGEFWTEQQLPPEALFPFELALEEIFINVVSYGGAGDAAMPPVEVRLELDGERISLTCIDHGKAFDPLKAPPPDLNASLEDRPIGGLGIFLIQELMDEVRYERVGPTNVLRIMRRATRD